MHEDAGQRRRRRMLLLMPRQRPAGQPESAALLPESAPELLADDEYFAACESEIEPTLYVEDLARRVLREQPLTTPVCLIGNGPENDLWLRHDRIQPRHLLLMRLPGGVFFLALSDEAEVLGPKGPLKSGWWTPNLILRVGAFRLRLNGSRKPPPAEDPLANSPGLDAELQRLELRFLSSTTPKRPWRISRTLTLVGRSPVCKIRLDHERIGSVHAILVRTPGRLWLINPGDPAGILVNDIPTLSSPLDVGDRLKIGDFRVLVQTADEWTESKSEAASGTAASGDGTNLEVLLQQFAAQHQKMLQTQRQALEELERLAGATSDPAQLKLVLDQIRKSYEALGLDQSRMQQELQRNLRDPS